MSIRFISATWELIGFLTLWFALVVPLLSRVRLFATPWTLAHQVSLFFSYPTASKISWQFCLSQNGHISTLSQNVRPRGWVTLLDQPGTGGSNDLQAHSHYKECRRCPSTKGPDQEDCKTMLKEWSASVELTGATGHNWQTREGNGNAFQYLTWRIPWTEKAVRLWSIVLQRVGHNWSNLAWTTE